MERREVSSIVGAAATASLACPRTSERALALARSLHQQPAFGSRPASSERELIGALADPRLDHGINVHVTDVEVEPLP